MKILMSLLLLIAVAFILKSPAVAAEPSTAFAVGLLMVGGWLTGLLCKKINVPAITGYLIYGAIIGPFALKLISQQQVESDLQFAGDLAVALIALTAGGEIHLPWLRGKVMRILTLLFFHILVLMVMLGGAAYFAKPFVPFMQNLDGVTILAIASMVSVVMVAKSPAVAVAMISDYRASGPLSQTTLVLTVFTDMILIILFATVLAVCKGMLDQGGDFSMGFLLGIAIQLIGSIALGALFGWLMALYAHKVNAHMIIFIVGGCMFMALLGEQKFDLLGQHIHLEPLLMALSAGLLMNNLWPEQTEPLFHSVESMSLPVYCLFFAIAGASIDMKVFGEVWMISMGLVIIRLIATWAGMTWGIRMGKLEGDWPRIMWLGMISQAGVSLVLVTLIQQTFPDATWAGPFKSTLIGAIFINQLIGPLCFRHALVKSGEVGQADREK